MSISVKCDECGKTLKAPDSAAGKKAKCPQCGAIVKIPEPVYEAEEAVEGESHEDADPFAGVGSFDSPAAPASDDRKPCPACGEMIVATAAKCRFCGEIFDAKMKKAARKNSKGGDDDDMTTGDWVAAVLCSGIGCIAGIIWMIQGKKKGLKMFGISFGFSIFWSIIRVAIQVSVQNGRP